MNAKERALRLKILEKALSPENKAWACEQEEKKSRYHEGLEDGILLGKKQGKVIVKEWGYNRGLKAGQKKGAKKELEHLEHIIYEWKTRGTPKDILIEKIDDKIEKRLKELEK